MPNTPHTIEERCCPNCEKPIHSLDGSVSHLPEPFQHIDCERAAGIDYGAAFDRLYQVACDLHRSACELMGLTGEGFDDPEAERTFVAIYARAHDAISHSYLLAQPPIEESTDAS